MIVRYLIFAIFSTIILLKTGWDLPDCNFKSAQNAVKPLIFAETTIDGKDQPVLITRFLHNKIGIFTHETSRCYFNVLDFNFVKDSTTLLGLFFWLYFIYQIIIRKLWLLGAAFLLIPMVPFLDFSSTLTATSHKVFAIMGLAWFARITRWERLL